MAYLRGNKRKLVIIQLIVRHGLTCEVCKKEVPEGQEDIDHINGDPFDNNIGNLRRLHHNCNAKIAWSQKNGVHASSSSHEREKVIAANMLSMQRMVIPNDLRDSYSNQVHYRKQPRFRLYLFNQIKTAKGCKRPADWLLDNASMKVDISLNTARNYLKPMCSEEGPFLRLEDTDGWVEFRQPEFEFLTEGELLEVFPCNIERTEATDIEKEKLIKLATSRMIEASKNQVLQHGESDP